MFGIGTETAGSLVGGPFRPVDVDRVAKRLKLTERGKQDGAAERPASNDASWAGAEQDVTGEIEAERARCAQDLTSHLRAYRDALAKLDAGMDIASLRLQADRAVSSFRQTQTMWAGDIAGLLRRAREAGEEYRTFREWHRIVRPARYPTERRMTVAWLVLVLALESILNGIFFAEGSELGLIGGIAVALSLSAVNVGAGAMTGWQPVRWLNHRNLLVKLIGAALVAGTLAGIVVLNGFVAHFRDAYEHAGDAVDLRGVWSRLTAEPFALARLQSWLLFALGIAAAGFAMWKGAFSDDPYPGYGGVTRRWVKAEAEYLNQRNTMLAEASGIRDEAVRALEAGIERLRGASQHREQLVNGRARIVADFRAHEEDLGRAANRLLALYREANVGSRTTPPPRHFNEAFAFPSGVLDRPEVRALLVDTPPPPVADLIKELDRLRRVILDEYESMLAAAPPAEM